MNETSGTNVLLEVAAFSMRVAAKYVAPYSHRNSQHKFTQSKLMTCLVLPAYLKTTYRGLIELLDTSDGMQIVDCMLQEIVQQFDAQATQAAIDSTGLETTSASAHYTTRSGKQRQKIIKVSVRVMIGSLLPSSVALSWGLGNDKSEAPEVLSKAANVNRPAVHRSDGQLNPEHRLRTTGSTLAARTDRSLFFALGVRSSQLL